MNNDIKKPQPPKQILRAGIYAPVPTFEEAFKDSTKTAETIKEWILIFVFYASKFGKHPTTKDDIIREYKEVGKYSETNRKNLASNVARCVKNNWIKSLNKDSYIILDGGKDYITEILAGRSRGKTRTKTQSKRKTNNK